MSDIPPLDHRGLLPEGRCYTDFMSVSAAFCTDSYRGTLWNKFIDFISFFREAHKKAHYPLALSGSFFTDKVEPNDIDCAILLNKDTNPLIGWNLGIWASENREKIKEQYSVDFWVSLPWANDFGAFWEYVGPKTAAAKGLHEKDKRGILVIEKWNEKAGDIKHIKEHQSFLNK